MDVLICALPLDSPDKYVGLVSLLGRQIFL